MFPLKDHIMLSDYDFHLPQRQIALRPKQQREDAKLLCIDNLKSYQNKYIRDFVDMINANDAIVVNETSVIKATLKARWFRGKTERKNIHVNIGSVLPHPHKFVIFTKNAKLQRGDELYFSHTTHHLRALIIDDHEDGSYTIECVYEGDDIWSIIDALGEVPLPHYITKRRQVDDKDSSDYQTIFASTPGAVAAPTAGLHFTYSILEKLRRKGVMVLPVCLHVGAGTFLPLREEIITSEQKLHSETGQIRTEIARQYNQIKNNGGRIFAIGTTVLRLLESASTKDGALEPFYGQTDIFIKPGYTFRSGVDYLLTNFHLPKSSLFILVSTFGGTTIMKNAYTHAIKEGYRFYSYGDACLIAAQK